MMKYWGIFSVSFVSESNFHKEYQQKIINISINSSFLGVYLYICTPVVHLELQKVVKVYKCTPQIKYMNITLKQKNLADGRISLFIEYYKGSSTNAQGRRVHLRNFEYLKLYLHPDPKSAKEKKRIKKL